MTTTMAKAVRPDPVPSLEAMVREIRGQLTAVLHAADDEIRSYPTPIPRCDAQFNHVYALRSRATRALHAVDDALTPPLTSPRLARALAAWRAEVPWGNDAAEQSLRDRVESVLARTAPDSEGATT